MADGGQEDFGGAGRPVGRKRQHSVTGGPATKKFGVCETEVQVKVLVPSTVVGSLIGKNGETLRMLKNISGCRIQISGYDDVYPGTTERICLIKGKVAACMTAIRAIVEKIQEKIVSSDSADRFDLTGMERNKEVKLLVSYSTARTVIGRGGAGIQEIGEDTAVDVHVCPEDGSDEANASSDRVITLGSDRNFNLFEAVHRVLEKISADPFHWQSAGISVRQQFGSGNSCDPSNDARYSFVQPSGLNPLLGLGNNELMNFLDNLQFTLRNSGFNEGSVREVMQAMQVLAKYNIMGLGLDVAALARRRTTSAARMMVPQAQRLRPDPAQPSDGSALPLDTGDHVHYQSYIGPWTDVEDSLETVGAADKANPSEFIEEEKGRGYADAKSVYRWLEKQ